MRAFSCLLLATNWILRFQSYYQCAKQWPPVRCNKQIQFDKTRIWDYHWARQKHASVVRSLLQNKGGVNGKNKFRFVFLPSQPSHFCYSPVVPRQNHICRNTSNIHDKNHRSQWTWQAKLPSNRIAIAAMIWTPKLYDEPWRQSTLRITPYWRWIEDNDLNPVWSRTVRKLYFFMDGRATLIYTLLIPMEQARSNWLRWGRCVGSSTFMVAGWE